MAEFEVYVDDNYHSMDEGSRYKAGSFCSYGDALARAKGIVDEFLQEHHRPGMTAKELYEGYTGFGEDPFIVPAGDPKFSARDYARARCAELCRNEDDVASVLRYPTWPAELEGFKGVLAAALTRKGLGAAERTALGTFEQAVGAYPDALPPEGRWYWLRLQRGSDAFTVYLHPDRFQLSVLGIFPEKVDWEVRFRGSGRTDRRTGDAALALRRMRDAALAADFTLRVSAATSVR